ncbi:MAG: C4-dicarboxylate ABC transporter [Phycisphaeraceae bacterium]|nr:C4-dicarboxylate ABC transporter [Phycisphaeraceae bacterium]
MDASAVLLILMFVTFVALLFTGYPIAFVLGGIGILFTGISVFGEAWFGLETDLNFAMLSLVVERTYRLMDSGTLVALPMFIFMGIMLDLSGIAERMMHSMQELFGPVRGGLAITVTVIGVILAASTGIIGASVVLLGLLTVPAMLKQGYAKELAVGVVCGSGCLGILIPPSIMLVIMADQLVLSVGHLFLGAVFPGLILAALYVIYIVACGFFRPETAPLASNRRPLSLRVVGDVLVTIIPPVFLIVLVLGSIFFGVATPTEASGVGALGATLLALFNRKLDRAVMRTVVTNSLSTSAFIFAILVGATCFSLAIRGLGGDDLVASALEALPFGPYGVLAVILAIVFLLGFVLDWIEITMIVLPLVSPVIGQLQFDVPGYGNLDEPVVIWFTVLVAVTLQTSFLTPPVGFALFYLKGVCPPQVSVGHIYRGVIPFIILQLIGLGIIVAFPQLVTWLPAASYSG